MLLAAIGGLTAAVTRLWYVHYREFNRTTEQLADCEQDRRSLWHALADHTRSDPETLRRRYSTGNAHGDAGA